MFSGDVTPALIRGTTNGMLPYCSSLPKVGLFVGSEQALMCNADKHGHEEDPWLELFHPVSTLLLLCTLVLCADSFCGTLVRVCAASVLASAWLLGYLGGTSCVRCFLRLWWRSSGSSPPIRCGSKIRFLFLFSLRNDSSVRSKSHDSTGTLGLTRLDARYCLFSASSPILLGPAYFLFSLGLSEHGVASGSGLECRGPFLAFPHPPPVFCCLYLHAEENHREKLAETVCHLGCQPTSIWTLMPFFHGAAWHLTKHTCKRPQKPEV